MSTICEYLDSIVNTHKYDDEGDDDDDVLARKKSHPSQLQMLKSPATGRSSHR